MGKVFTASEIAGKMRVTKQTVFGWIGKGWLPAIKVGRTVRIKEEDFGEFLKTYYQGSNNKAEVNK